MAATSSAKRSTTASPAMSIDDYDRLSVKQILPLLANLSAAELGVVVAHEKAGKNRVTLLQGIRKIELAREAAANRKAPASHLTVVEDEIEVVADEPELGLADSVDPTDLIDSPAPPPLPPVRATGRSKRTKAAAAPPVVTIDETFDDALDELDGSKAAQTRSAAKHVTWEEEPRPTLPRRIENYAYDYEPPVVALVPPESESMPTPVTSGSRKAVKTPSTGATGLNGVIGLVRRFERAALVMAAILAVLLGLAIGTVLARTGGSTAQPTEASVATQTAAVQPAG